LALLRIEGFAAELFVVITVTACAPIALAGPGCGETVTGIALPPELEESSGVAVGLRNPDVFWTHNDDGSVLYAIERGGTIQATYTILPTLRDWEDIAVAACEDHGSCLYLADTGDNAERRGDGNIRVLRIAEPSLSASEYAGGNVEAGRREIQGEVFPLRLPEGARDVEALFVLPGERLYVVTKGRNHAITVYGYPSPLRPDTVTLETVQRLTDNAAPLGDQVTGASVSPSGDVVSIRTYQSLEFFKVQGDTLARFENGMVNLRTLGEAQGEAVGLGADGFVVLTSEGGIFGGSPGMNLLRCSLESD
jgi:hypothetical protein